MFSAASRPSRNANDLASFVVAARWTDAMRDIRGSTLRASAKLRQLHDAVVSTPHPLAALGGLSFWDTHKFNS
jgi:hypothetical protein